MRAVVASRMQLVLLLCLFAIAIARVGALRCRDHTGNAVDRFWVHYLGGSRGWYYWSSAMGANAPLYFADAMPYSAAAFPVRQTLTQAGMDPNAPGPNARWFHYQDFENGNDHAHARGTLAWDVVSSQGFHLTHSLPKFPAALAGNNPYNPYRGMTTATRGQHYMCVSFNNAAGPAIDFEFLSATALGGAGGAGWVNAPAAPIAAGGAGGIAINFHPNTVGGAILTSLQLRNARVYRPSNWVGGLAHGDDLMSDVQDSVVPHGFYRARFQSAGVGGGGAQTFDLIVKRQAFVADLWTEAVAPFYQIGGAATYAHVQTYRCGGAGNNPAQCCGGAGVVAPVAGALPGAAGAATLGSCPANCAMSSTAALGEVATAFTYTQAYTAYLGIHCPAGVDVSNVHDYSLANTVFAVASAGPTLAARQNGATWAGAVAPLGGATPFRSWTTDHAKYAVIDRGGGLPSVLCAGDLNRQGGAGLSFNVGNNWRGGAVLCTTSMPSVITLLTQLRHAYHGCPSLPSVNAPSDPAYLLVERETTLVSAPASAPIPAEASPLVSPSFALLTEALRGGARARAGIRARAIARANVQTHTGTGVVPIVISAGVRAIKQLMSLTRSEGGAATSTPQNEHFARLSVRRPLQGVQRFDPPRSIAILDDATVRADLQSLYTFITNPTGPTVNLAAALLAHVFDPFADCPPDFVDTPPAGNTGCEAAMLALRRTFLTKLNAAVKTWTAIRTLVKRSPRTAIAKLDRTALKRSRKVDIVPGRGTAVRVQQPPHKIEKRRIARSAGGRAVVVH